MKYEYEVSVGATAVTLSSSTKALRDLDLKMRERESRAIETAINALEPGDVFYDIGANRGVYALLAAARHPTIQSVAIEPFPANLEALSRDADRNNLSVSMYQVALTDEDGEAVFDVAKQAGEGHRSGAIRPEAVGTGITVDTRRLDTLRERNIIPPPDVMKVDVEGAEPAVFRGMERTLTDTPPRDIVFEIHDHERVSGPRLTKFGMTADELCSYIANRGFRITKLGEASHGNTTWHHAESVERSKTRLTA